MEATYDINARKKSANLSINSSLLAQARSLNINLPALEQALAEMVRQRQRELWLAENQETIAAYTVFVEEHGVFSITGFGFRYC